MHLDTGYDLWARIVDKTLTADKLKDFLTVADRGKKDPLLIQRYFVSSQDTVTLTQLVSNNGPSGTITNVQSVLSWSSHLQLLGISTAQGGLYFLTDPFSITYVLRTSFATQVTFHFNYFCTYQGKKLSILHYDY